MICRYAKLCFYHLPKNNLKNNLDENDNEVEISNYRPISDNEQVQMQVPRVDSARFRLWRTRRTGIMENLLMTMKLPLAMTRRIRY